MTLSTPITFARAKAQTDSNGLSDASAIIFANEALEDFHRKLINENVDASQLTEVYRDGTAGTGTYLYPSDLLFLKAIELNYQNTSADEYIPADQIDVSNLPSGKGFGWWRTNANESNPKFDDRGDWYEIFPTPTSSHNVSQLIRLFYYKKPTQYTATTDTVAYPENLDQAILGFRIAANYMRSKEKFEAADKLDIKYEEKVNDYINTLKRGTQMPLKAESLRLTGYEF